MTAAESQVRAMAQEMAKHHRLDPMTSRDRCTCGHLTELGKLFTEHVAKLLITDGWRKP